MVGDGDERGLELTAECLRVECWVLCVQGLVLSVECWVLSVECRVSGVEDDRGTSSGWRR